MSDYEHYCNCEWGPLGTGRLDSNRCPIHDMSQAEQIAWGILGWDEAERLEQQNVSLQQRVEALEKELSDLRGGMEFAIGMVVHQCEKPENRGAMTQRQQAMLLDRIRDAALSALATAQDKAGEQGEG